jgi:uncharacterized protein YggE
MKRPIIFLLFCSAALAQQTNRGYIRAYGEGVVSTRPDQARVTFSVVTTGPTANEVSAQNAVRSSAVLDQLRSLLGTKGELKTLSYSLAPNYNYPRDGSPPQLVGFTATNVIEAAVSDIAMTGNTIDAGVQAGATRVDGLRLTLKDDEDARAQALRTAGQKARAKAQAIATGLGVRLGAVLAAEEGITVRTPGVDRGAPTATTTPVEPGTLEVRATVTLEIEIVP